VVGNVERLNPGALLTSTRWVPEVADFLKLDYEPLSGAKL
jgi:hypothetical protein